MQTRSPESADLLAAPALTIHVRLFALYREAAGQDEIALTVPAGATVRDLWPPLLAASPGLARAGAGAASTAYAVNGTWAKGGHALHDGDEVAFLPPVSGG
jgi:molybdopterin converting factor small subunit